MRDTAVRDEKARHMATISNLIRLCDSLRRLATCYRAQRAGFATYLLTTPTVDVHA